MHHDGPDGPQTRTRTALASFRSSADPVPSCPYRESASTRAGRTEETEVSAERCDSDREAVDTPPPPGIESASHGSDRPGDVIPSLSIRRLLGITGYVVRQRRNAATGVSDAAPDGSERERSGGVRRHRPRAHQHPRVIAPATIVPGRRSATHRRFTTWVKVESVRRAARPGPRPTRRRRKTGLVRRRPRFSPRPGEKWGPPTGPGPVVAASTDRRSTP